MQNYEEPPGASYENPDDQLKKKLKGEILASLADWRKSYDLEGPELGWIIMNALLNHIHRYEGLEVRAEFTQRLAKMSGETIDEIMEVLRLDAAANNKLH